jgi:glucose-6-phosphate 1-dehydrogenase
MLLDMTFADASIQMQTMCLTPMSDWIADVIRGNQTLFMRGDESKRRWPGPTR